MRAALGNSCCAPLLASGAAAEPSAPTITQLFHICASSTVPEATARVGGALGWEPIPDREVEEWRSGFTAYHQLDVSVGAWRQSAEKGADRLAFWISGGPEGHMGCAYTSNRAGNLLDALSAQLGEPRYLKRHELAVTADWKTPDREIAFSQLDATAIIYVSRRN